jgi:hypothetical protein
MRIIHVIGILILLGVLAAAAGCTGQKTSTIVTPTVTIATADGSATQKTFSMIPQAPLNASETTDIVFLQEAEKLSHDLNVKLYGLHTDVPVFLHIANSSQVLQTADNVILVRYNIPNPENEAAGVFTNAALQQMYTTGVNAGLSSAADALKSSAAVEDMHIADLTAAIQRTDNADVIFVYKQELAASRNNLRALSQWISAYGQTYVPQYITPASYAAIITSPMESLPVQ